MKHIKSTLLLLCLAIGFSGAARAAETIGYFETIESDPAIKSGETYYLRHNLMYEKDTWDATNYWRGVLLPINTKVKVERLDTKSMKISWDGGILTIQNSQHTKRDMAAIAKRMLGPKEVPISKFGKEMAECIRNGQQMKGMTREQVIMTRGYPPAHKTPSITGDNGRWTYWSSRFVTETLVISGGKLQAGRNMIQ